MIVLNNTGLSPPLGILNLITHGRSPLLDKETVTYRFQGWGQGHLWETMILHLNTLEHKLPTTAVIVSYCAHNPLAHFATVDLILLLLFKNIFYSLILEIEREGGRERREENHQFVVALIYAFIGCFLCVPWPGMELSTLAYLDKVLIKQLVVLCI